MRDFEFIHSGEDVAEILHFAAGIGLTIRKDEPGKLPLPTLVRASDIENMANGVFFLYKPEWIFDEVEFIEIGAGYFEGKFSQKPATNCASVNLYFGGERDDGQLHRLGGGFLARDVNWYRSSDHTVHRAPADVKAVFDVIRKRIDTGKRLRGGIHNYAVLAGAWKKLIAGSAAPPFDYIRWPPE